jgi:choline kinase
MKAVILAAGMASRLRPLTEHTPKCLLKIGRRCLLQRTVDTLESNGIHEIIVVTGYLHLQIENFLKQTYPDLAFDFIYNDKYQSTNNIYSLWLTCAAAAGEEIVLLDSDILFDPLVLQSVLSSPVPNVLALNRHELGEEEIKVVVGKNGEVEEISKTCSPADAEGESVGIEKMSPAYTETLFSELRQMIEVEHLTGVFYEQAFERLIPRGQFFCTVDTTAHFSIELDTVDDFHQAQKLIPADLY